MDASSTPTGAMPPPDQSSLASARPSFHTPRAYSALAVAVIFTLISVLGSAVAQRWLAYLPASRAITPTEAGLAEVTEGVLVTPDGQRLATWSAPARPGKPTVLYLHGNSAGLGQRAPRVVRLIGAGLGVYMMSYRGFPGSTGLPSEEANVADALTAYDHLRGLGTKPEDIVIYGESLGTNIAARVALVRPARALVLEAPYTSVVDVGAMRYPWLPVRWAMIDRYNTLALAPQLRLPTMVVHGKRDQVVPYAMGEEVFAAIDAPKKMITFPDAGHADLWRQPAMDDVMAWMSDQGRSTQR